MQSYIKIRKKTINHNKFKKKKKKIGFFYTFAAKFSITNSKIIYENEEDSFCKRGFGYKPELRFLHTER